MQNKIKGFFYGIVTSVTFGLIPLFTLPLMPKGMPSDSSLFYRFLVATMARGIMMLIKKESFRISLRDLPILVMLALFYTASAMFLLYGYEVMGAGVATTLHFTYPVFVTLLMLLLFREKTSWVTWTAIILAVAGVARLSLQGAEMQLAPASVAIVLLSAVGYASSIIAVNTSRIKDIHSRKLAFYVFVCTTMIVAIQPVHDARLHHIPHMAAAAHNPMPALTPTLVSSVLIILARTIPENLTLLLNRPRPRHS